MCTEKHPRRASRDPLKGAMPEARQSRFLGISGWDPVAPVGFAPEEKGLLS